MNDGRQKRRAVLIPCYNEEKTIGKVIDDFRRQLPEASIYVFNNASTDRTAAAASEHGAIVIPEPRRGKGFVVECMFDSIDADVYIMVDGDDTYPAEAVHELIAPVEENRADMVIGARLDKHRADSFRPLHLWGNRLVCRLVNWICKADLTDIMSGYRAFGRRVIERIPVVSQGFEIETELTIQTLYHQLAVVEINVPYGVRPSGSQSKLRTFQDGFLVLWKIFRLFRSLKPLTFFGGCGIVFFLLGLLAGMVPIHDYYSAENHYVSHVPLAILASALMLLSAICVFLGILLHTLNCRLRELHSILIRRGHHPRVFRRDPS